MTALKQGRPTRLVQALGLAAFACALPLAFAKAEVPTPAPDRAAAEHAPPPPTISAHIAASVDVASPRAGRAVSTEDLFELNQIGDAIAHIALSPDQRLLAAAVRRMDVAADRLRYDIVVVPVDARTTEGARIIGDGGGFIAATRDGRRSGGALARQLAWSNDSQFVFHLAERDGQVEIWKSAAGSVTQRAAPASARVAAFEGDVRRFGLSADGSRLIVETLTARAELERRARQARRDGFRLDERFDAVYGLKPMPEELAERAFWSVDLTTGAREVATPEEEMRLEGAEGAATGAVARIGPREPGDAAHRPRLALDYVDVANGTSVRCEAAACSGALEAAWTLPAAPAHHHRRVLFQRLEHAGALTALYLWEMESGAAPLVRRAEERLLACTPGARALFCVADAPTQPRRIIAIGLGTGAGRSSDTDAFGAHRVLYDPNPEWRTRALPRIARLDVEDTAGNRSFAHLIYPNNWRRGRRAPLVIVQYRSRGFLLGGTGGEYPILPLAAHGYFVLSLDRPENEAVSASLPTAEWMRRTERDGSENAVKMAQIEALIDHLDTGGLIDPARIAITGMSDGAETIYAMLNHGYPFAAAIVSTPPSDPISWSFMAGRYRQSLIDRFGMTSPDDRDSPWARYWSRAARHHAERYQTPVLFQLAESEALYALPLLQRLREADIPTEAYLYPGAYHVKSSPAHLARAQERSLAWIDFWLMDHASAPLSSSHSDAAPDGDRLARWRALKARWRTRASDSAQADAPHEPLLHPRLLSRTSR